MEFVSLKIRIITIGIFILITDIAAICVYQIDPVDIIKYRFQYEDIPLGEYPHTSDCIGFQDYLIFVSLLIITSITTIIIIAFLENEVSRSTSEVVKAIYPFLVFGPMFGLLLICQDTYEKPETSLGEAITSENFILHRTSGCQRYLLDHHMASFISLCILLPLPGLLFTGSVLFYLIYILAIWIPNNMLYIIHKLKQICCQDYEEVE